MPGKKKICPKCQKTDEVIPIVYGYPTESLFEKAEKGKVLLGGCCVMDIYPKWYCKRDKIKF